MLESAQCIQKGKIAQGRGHCECRDWGEGYDQKF